MFQTFSSSAFFAASSAPRPPRPPHSTISSVTSSAFSSQHFTQSDTEAEEEKRFMNRREQRRQVLTPNALMFGGRRDFLTPVPFASCSTPRSSQEDLLFDQTSVYFRPIPQQQRYGRREEKMEKGGSNKRMLDPRMTMMANNHNNEWHNRQSSRRPRRRRGGDAPATITGPATITTMAHEGGEGGRIERKKCGNKTPQLGHNRHPLSERGGGGCRVRRTHSNNPLMAFFGDDEGGPVQCSTPILLDFPISPKGAGENEDGCKLEEAKNNEKDNMGMEGMKGKGTKKIPIHCHVPSMAICVASRPPQIMPCPSKCKSSNRRRMSTSCPCSPAAPDVPNISRIPQMAILNRILPYSNLSPFLRFIPPFAANKISPIFRGGRQSNSDSGMEERNTLEDEEVNDAHDDSDKRTQFVNMSRDGDEKFYENLPPVASLPPLPPSRLPPPQPPRPLHQLMMSAGMGEEEEAPNSRHFQPSSNQQGELPPAFLPQPDDVPTLYGRLVAAAFVEARKCPAAKTNPLGNARRIRLAQRQMAELVALRLTKPVELSGTLDSDENFRRKSADFGIQLAQKLRQMEACSRKEFNWQVKKLQKMLHELRTAEVENADGAGTLQKLFRRVFSWK